jgi:hypothetical protein
MTDKPDKWQPRPLSPEERTAAKQRVDAAGTPRQLMDWFELICWWNLLAALLWLGLSALGAGLGDCDPRTGFNTRVPYFLSAVLIIVGIVEAAIAVIAVRPWRRGLGFGLLGIAVVAITSGAVLAAGVAANANSCD